MQLYIGNKNYSSWSLRAWLMLKKNGIQFEEIKLKLDTPAFYTRLRGVTPTLQVPTLINRDITVWDSLAICEYINDTYLSGQAWPQDISERAKARAIACEMHAGFSGVRNELPMNIRAERSVKLSEQAQKDIKRIEEIWSTQYQQYGRQGVWLFGQWSIADAMYAPVVLRFKTYGIQLNESASQYMQHVLACPVLQHWVSEALQEADIVASDEAGEERDK